jgi:two-component system sensor histidine kinase ChvG
MARDIALLESETSFGETPLFWSARWSLTTRILIVNIVAIAMLAAGFFYLDSYRTRLVDAREATAVRELALLDIALDDAPPTARSAIVREFARASEGRIRIYDSGGRKIDDSFALAPPNYSLRGTAGEPWRKSAARAMDQGIDWIVGAPNPARFVEPARDSAAAWPELTAARTSGKPAHRFRYAPDRTPMVSAALFDADSGEQMLFSTNARSITTTVREERLRLGIVLVITLIVSILLSLFLARTIVLPLRRLARAAVRVRLGRAREVTVPRLPDRRDEIGTLARALSDMTQALRERIDAGEHFAADVTHELKNPIASLRSAIDGLGNVKQEAQRAQLLAIAADDVRRLDRLITDISEVSRMDAQLSRSRFERVDAGAMIEALLTGRQRRAAQDGSTPQIAYARPRKGTATVMGDSGRLERAIGNVVDNALSFARPGGLVRVAASRVGDDVRIRVEDDGPGVPADQREAIFHRFHSVRPSEEAFGQHSGLGLAIARTVIEGHQGSITVCDREDGGTGACFVITLPAA